MRTEPWFLSGGQPKNLDWPVLWAKVVDEHADYPAIQLKDHSLSFGQLDRLAHVLASALANDIGNPRKAVVAVPTDRPDFLTAFIALWELGSTIVPYSSHTLVNEPALRKLIDSFVDVWLNDQYSPIASRPRKSSNPRIINFPDETPHHAIFFTSGSTGGVKGVLRGWRQALYEAGQYAATLGLRPGLRNVMLLDPIFGASTKHLIGSLLMGCSQSFPRLHGGGDKPINGHVIYGTPSHFLGHSPNLDQCSGFAWVSLTGEAPNQSTLSAASRFLSPEGKILNAFGGTEFGVAINETISPWQENMRIRTLLPHKCLLILDDRDQVVPDGTSGRLAVFSHQLAEGYIALNGNLNSACFGRFQKHLNGSSQVFTGDIAVKDNQGSVIIQGRENAMVKYRGKWLDTTPLRDLLSQQAQIKEFVLDRDPETDKLKVCIVPATHADRSQLILMCENMSHRLGGQATGLGSANYFLIDNINRNRNGKMDLQWLSTATMVPLVSLPRSASDDILDYLIHGVSAVSNDFAGLSIHAQGLDSIEILQLAIKLERYSKSPVDLSVFMEDRPISSLRNEIWRKIGRSTWPLELGMIESKRVMLWFGFAGITAVRQEFSSKSRILYFDCDLSINLDPPSKTANIESIVKSQLECCIETIESANSIMVGGFSYGALVAHEATHQLEQLSMPVDQVILLDPTFKTGLKINTLGRFLRDSIIKAVRKYLRVTSFPKVEATFRKGLRQTTLAKFKPNIIKSNVFIMTTTKRRQSIEMMLNNACHKAIWQHEITHRHYDVMTKQEYQAKWLDKIRLWVQ
jgi:acyl-coenzyme A synthetase/AMP-(fatty) acid ligase